MADNSCRSSTELLMPKKCNERSEANSTSDSSIANKLVPVVYYLSRNGQLEHPHFIQVPLSTSDGLYLRDVMNKLNSLRGNRVAYMYSWSSKRSYKSGYVWQDLSEDDLIQPTDGCDYVLKGSEILQASRSFRSHREKASSLNETRESSSIKYSRREKNQSWSEFENSNEYRVYKCESSRELGGKLADVATQTEEKARERRSKSFREDYLAYGNNNYKRVELSREELSPPSMSSSECVSRSGDADRRGSDADPTAEIEPTSGKMKASRVLMQLLTCGSSSSAPVQGYGSIANKEKHRGNSMRTRYVNS